MDECSECGISGVKARLFDVVSSKGIIKLCSDCLKGEEMPVIKRPTTFQLKESEEGFSSRARIAEGIRKKEIQRRSAEKADISLRELVDKNYEKKIPSDRKPRSDLVDNFHWVIMRARRSKKVTQEQLARDIAESLSTIKLAEQGVLPEDDYRLISKLENYLFIRIIREDAKQVLTKKKILDVPEKFRFDTAQNLTIADLQELKKQKDKISTEVVQEDEEIDLADFSGEDISGKEVEKELDNSKRSLRELIFGKKKE